MTNGGDALQKRRVVAYILQQTRDGPPRNRTGGRGLD